mmetsp:Transcript_2550/g.3771  ORF Transcript_2550/g.3771 Transcript_2550/m.3771 type:complete len:368 (+) Transcript_2550:84-1187(+)
MKDEPWAYAKLWGNNNGKEITKYITALPAKIGRFDSSTNNNEPGFINLGPEAKGVSRHHATIDWVPDLKRYKIQCFGKNGMIVGGKSRNIAGEELLSSRTAIKIGPCCMYFLLPEEGTQPISRVQGKVEKPLSGPALQAAQLHQQAVQQNMKRIQENRGKDATNADSPPRLHGSTDISMMPSHQGLVLGQQQLQQSNNPKNPPPHALTGLKSGEIIAAAFESEQLKNIALQKGGLTTSEITKWALDFFPGTYDTADARKALTTGIQGVLSRNGEKGPTEPGKKGARWTMRASGSAKKRKPEEMMASQKVKKSRAEGEMSTNLKNLEGPVSFTNENKFDSKGEKKIISDTNSSKKGNEIIVLIDDSSK